MSASSINWGTVGEVLNIIEKMPPSDFIHEAFTDLPLERKKELLAIWMQTKDDLAWFISSIKREEHEKLYNYLTDIYES